MEIINEKTIVRNYIDNANIKEYVYTQLVPKYFPNIPVSRLNVGEIGLLTELLGNIAEDGSFGTGVALGESFISKAFLDESIYYKAAVYDLGYKCAVPAECNVMLEIQISDIIDASVGHELKIDKDTHFIIDGKIYSLDYDIIIRYSYIGGEINFETLYDIDYTNSISFVNNQFISNRVATNGWLILFLKVREYVRTEISHTIITTDIFTSSDIDIPYTDMLAGFDAIYHSPSGKTNMLMQQKYLHTVGSSSPFLYKRMKDLHTVTVSFSPNKTYWQPEGNSTIDFYVYTTHGVDGNFDIAYNAEVGVVRNSERYSSNEGLHMVAIPYNQSQGGSDQPTIEQVRWDTIEAMNTCNVLATDNDLAIYFDNYSRVNDTYAKFFKRRDDPTGRLFAMFNIIKDTEVNYIYPTLTSEIRFNQRTLLGTSGASVNENNMFTIQPGTVWTYPSGASEYLEMGSGSILDVSYKPDQPLQTYVNPYLIKVSRIPNAVGYYNVLMNHESILFQENYNQMVQEHFVANKISVVRTLTSNKYHVKVSVVPNAPAEIYNTYDLNKNYHYAYPQDLNHTYSVPFSTLNVSDYVDLNSALSRWLLDTHRLDPVNGFCIIDTETNDKYIFDSFKRWMRIYANTFPLKVVISVSTYNETGYMELLCTEDNNGILTFEGDIYTIDNVENADGSQRVECVTNPKSDYGMKSLIKYGGDSGKAFISAVESKIQVYLICDSIFSNDTIPKPDYAYETDFSTSPVVYDDNPTTFSNNITTRVRSMGGEVVDEATIYNVDDGRTYIWYDATGRWMEFGAPALFNEPNFRGYTVTDTFINNYSIFDVMKPLTQMRSNVSFTGSTFNYNMAVSLVPFVRYDVAIDDDMMLYFIKTLNQQYDKISDLLSNRLMENASIDYKLYNTCGKSNFFLIGKTSDETSDMEYTNLDTVRLTISFTVGLDNVAGFPDALNKIRSYIKNYVETLNDEGTTDFFISNLIRGLEETIPNIRYIVFNGINGYSTEYQAIKAITQVDNLSEDDMKRYVPEILTLDIDNISISLAT